MKRLITLLLISFLMVLALTGFGSMRSNTAEAAEATEVFTLKIADHWPVTHMMMPVIKFMIERMEELSNGRIKVEHFPAGQLGSPRDYLKLVIKGGADITFVAPSFFMGQLPLQSVMALPFFTTSVEGTEIYNRLYNAVPELEQELHQYGIRNVFAWVTHQYDVGMTKPIASPEDLKGKKISCPGGIMLNIAKRYGINPVSISGPEKYEATQKGILDGNFSNLPTLASYKLYEVQKYHTYGARLGGFIGLYCMNEKSFQRLPEDLQKAVLKAGAEASKRAAMNWDQKSEELVDQLQKEGVTFTIIKSKEDRAKWDAPIKGIEQSWLDDMNKKGLPAQKVFDAFYKISNEVAK